MSSESIEQVELEPLIIKARHRDGKESFYAEDALAFFLSKGICFLNSHWWREDCPEDIKKSISVSVNCGDFFDYACADAEIVFYEELEDLYNHYVKDNDIGVYVWCAKKRGQLPIKEWYDTIQSFDKWNLNEMNLKPNPNWC